MKLSTLALMTLVSLASSEDEPRVQTRSGAIKGHYKISSYGRKYRAFEGIPYAQPPVGDLRFEDPQPVNAWKNELSATNLHVCIQHNYNMSNPIITGSEDCLYLNVYAPIMAPNATLLPVIFYIYGGALRTGSGGRFGSAYLLNRDIVLITFNYRLGPLGWLSTEDDVVPGNLALKDQSTALRWVSENIEAFGGNSSRIMLAGHSSGGANVHHHYFSPWSAGLYEKGISMSSTAFNHGLIVANPLEKAEQLAGFLNCTTANTTAMVSCLKSVDASDILATMPNFLVLGSYPTVAFGPVVEKSGDAPFLNATPHELIASKRLNDVPWITGLVSEEGAHPMCTLAINKTIMENLDKEWDTLIPQMLSFRPSMSATDKSKVATLIREHYFGSAPIDFSTKDTLIDLIGANVFNIPAVNAAKLQAKANKSPVWFYYNSYRGAHSVTDTLTGTKINFGVSHGDDIFYIMENSYENMTSTAKDRAMQNELIDFWMSYAYNDSPSVGAPLEWPPLDPDEDSLSFMHFHGPGNFTWDTVINFSEIEFWNSIDI